MPRLCWGILREIACDKFALYSAALQTRGKAKVCERAARLTAALGNAKRLVIFHALQHLLKSMGAKVDQALERTMDVGYRYEGKAEQQRERKDL